LSLTIKSRDAVAVTLLQDIVSPPLLKTLRIVVDAVTLCFAVTLLYLCYLWFNPVVLYQVGFDFKEFAGATFNFMYDEPTATLGLPKWVFWLAVPIAALTMSVHAAANLLQTL